MKKYKKLLALALAAVMISLQPGGTAEIIQAKNRVSSGTASNIRSGITTGEPEAAYNSDVGNLQYVTPVENQNADNCWAYMADAVLESYLKKQTGVVYNFSEAAMIAQLSNGSTDTQYGFTDLSNGGNFHQALAYWTRGSKYGPVLEGGTASDVYVTQTVELGSYANDSEKADYLKDIKNLVKAYGAVGVSIYYDRNAQSSTTNNGAYYSAGTAVNHGVAVVGWDDNYSASNFVVQPARAGAFLVKNSWGTDEPYSCQVNGRPSGYYWISYENYFKDAFAIKETTSRSNLYHTLYETDYRGLADYGTSAAGYSNTYTAVEEEAVTAVGTYVQPGTTYSFAVDGTNVSLQESGQMTQGGYHVFRLHTPVRVAAGSNFTVKAQMSGGNWVPQSATETGATDSSNVCLKVYMSNNLVPTKPTVSAACNGQALSNNAWVQSKEIIFSASGSTLNGNGTVGYEYQVDGGTWTKIDGTSFAYAPPAEKATHTVTVRAYNRAFEDYYSESQDFQIRVDNDKPAIGSAASKPRTDGSGVVVEVTGLTDADSGIGGYYYSESSTEPTASSSWTTLWADHFSFYSTKNTTYYIWVKDQAGNISEMKSLVVNGAPTVSQVTVTHDAQLAYRGSICKFSASVTGTNNPAQTVTWRVSGASDPDTAITANGELTIGCVEYSASLEVTATSTVDTSKSGSVIVTPISQTGSITSVIVNPQTVTVPKGRSQSFTVRVIGTNSPAQLVNWSLSGNQSANTSYANGTLYVSSDETADTLYLTAVSKADARMQGISTIKIVENNASSQIYTVRFYDNGILQNTQNVRYGKAAVAPSLVREGFALSWDRAFDYVTTNLDVHAVWTPVIYSGSTGNQYTDTATNTWTDTAVQSSAADDEDGYTDYDSDEVIEVATVNKSIYTVKMDGTAHYKKNSASGKKRITVTVPNSIMVNDLSYRVTALDSGCFRNNTKLRTVSLGANVKKIGASAFSGCSKLKSVRIKSKKVTKIASGAFRGIASNAVIHVPRSRLAKYRKMIRNSGNSTARVKAF